MDTIISRPFYIAIGAAARQIQAGRTIDQSCCHSCIVG